MVAFQLDKTLSEFGGDRGLCTVRTDLLDTAVETGDSDANRGWNIFRS